jgi:hypothetical protein
MMALLRVLAVAEEFGHIRLRRRAGGWGRM